jgi:hypothetical protein
MSKKQVEFNAETWHSLLTFTEKHGRLPKILEICENEGVSNRLASAYYFALNNRFELFVDTHSASTLRKYKNVASSKAHDLKQALVTIEEQQAKIDFLEAIELFQEHEFSRVTISKVDMSVDENTAISCIGDAHVDEDVIPEVVNNLNEYSPKIAEERIRRYFKRLMFLIRSFRAGGRKINHLVLGVLGDLLSGYIHEELMENNSISPTEAVLLLGSLFADGIKFLSEDGEFETIKIVMIRGNHGRTSRKKKFSTGYKNSYEWMLYTQIQRLFKSTLSGYDNIEFIVPKSEFAFVDIYDTTNSFSHGDHFRYAGGVGGVTVPFQRWIYKMNEVIPADKRFIGHWHQYVNIPGGAINGSVIGYNAFAMGIGAKPEAPKMQLQLIDSKRGYTVNEPIILIDW